mgnify:CR=1 FL=1|nr:MAG TPA: hypothetical protein [Caudoviricetes sp.]
MNLSPKGIVSAITFLFSIVNIAITLYNWYHRRPHIEFYKSYTRSAYIKPRKEHEHYLNSKGIAFFFLRIANISELPCTISEFSLDVTGFPTAHQYGMTDVLDRYILHSDCNIHGESRSKYILKENIIQLPYTIPPLGYVEGYAIFPFIPDYKGKEICAKLTVHTAKRRYKTKGRLLLYTNTNLPENHG